MPNFFNLISRPFLHTMSNAFSKSMKTAMLMFGDEILESDDMVCDDSASSKTGLGAREQVELLQISLWFVASLSISLLRVDLSDIGRYDDVRCGSFPDFSIGRTIACFQAFGRGPLRQMALNNRRMANHPVAGICWKHSYVIWSSPGAELFFSCWVATFSSG